MADVSEKKYCCTTAGSLCYWWEAFLILLCLGLAVVYPLHLIRYALVVLFAAMGLACIVNLVRNRTFHCVITAPFFLVVSALLALQVAGIWSIGAIWLWPIVCIVVCAAFLLERRFAS
jgi:hypothetical protein